MNRLCQYFLELSPVTAGLLSAVLVLMLLPVLLLLELRDYFRGYRRIEVRFPQKYEVRPYAIRVMPERPEIELHR
jgi:hypothetical protein